MSLAQRDHVIIFRRAHLRYQKMNLGASPCRTLSVQDARRLHPLPLEEQAEADWFLAEKHRSPEPAKSTAGSPSVFDEPPQVRG